MRHSRNPSNSVAGYEIGKSRSSIGTLQGGKIKAAAKALRVELDEIGVEVPEALETAMRGAKDRGAQAVYVWAGGFPMRLQKEISELQMRLVCRLSARSEKVPSLVVWSPMPLIL